jgi:hypothetical protein
MQARNRLHLKVEATQAAPMRDSLGPVEPAEPSWSFDDTYTTPLKSDSPESDSGLLPDPPRGGLHDELTRAKKEHEQELQQLRNQLDACKAEAAKTEGELNKKIADKEIQWVRMRNKKIADKEIQWVRMRNKKNTDME